MDFLRDYSRENHYEYFAEYFVYWLENHDDPVRTAQMNELTPQTYHFFCEIAENNWGFTVHYKATAEEICSPPLHTISIFRQGDSQYLW